MSASDNIKQEQPAKRHLVQEMEDDAKRLKVSPHLLAECSSTKTFAQQADEYKTVQYQSTTCHPSISEEVKKLLKNSSCQYDSEYFSDIFTCKGGELRHWTTDDYLEIPPGAVPEDQDWEVQGKIHTSLDNFVDVFLKGETKQFRSCVLEYCIKNSPSNEKRQFLTRVIINIRHSVTDQCARDNLRVFCLEDDNQVIEIFKQTHNLAASDPWFELHEDFLRIHTFHFCKYTCVCTASNDLTRDIQYFIATLYGKVTRVPDENSKYIADLSFALWAHVEDGVEKLPEFREVTIICNN